MDAVRPRLRWKQQNLHFVVRLRSAPAKIFEKSIFRTTEALHKGAENQPHKIRYFCGVKTHAYSHGGYCIFSRCMVQFR